MQALWTEKKKTLPTSKKGVVSSRYLPEIAIGNTQQTPACYLLRVMFLVRQQCGDVKHDLDAPPVGVDRCEPGEVMDRVQTALVLIESCNRTPSPSAAQSLHGDLVPFTTQSLGSGII